MCQTRWVGISATVILAILLGGPIPARAQFPSLRPSPAPQAPVEDPRVAQVTTTLEKQGLKVLGAGIVRGPGFYQQGDTTVWWVDTAAAYAQPNDKGVSRQALVTWGVMYDILVNEPPVTILSGAQYWTKYALVLQTRMGDLTTLVKAVSGTRTEPEKEKAFEAFAATMRFRVYDVERRQFVDEKDFMNKNFTR